MTAFGLYRSAFGKVVITAALALLPALLVMSGAVVFGLAALGAPAPAEASVNTPEVQERRRAALASGDQQTHTEVGRDALRATPPVERDLRHLLPVVYACAVIALLLLIGLSLAQAALVPLAAAGGNLRPSEAWAAVSGRIGPLVQTCLLGAALVAAGTVFLVVPGLLAALAFSFAVPVTLLEGVSGREALDRSWRRMHGRWGRVALAWLGILAVGLFAAAVARQLPWGMARMLVATAIRVVLLPLPLLVLVVAYLEGSPQYMRRISAPG